MSYLSDSTQFEIPQQYVIAQMALGCNSNEQVIISYSVQFYNAIYTASYACAIDRHVVLFFRHAQKNVAWFYPSRMRISNSLHVGLFTLSTIQSSMRSMVILVDMVSKKFMQITMSNFSKCT